MLYSRFPGGLLHLLNNDMKNKDKNVRVPIRGGSKATCHIIKPSLSRGMR